MYDQGFVFTRIGKGVMQQTRSVRIDLNKFNLSSENRRILKKNEGLYLIEKDLPVSDYFYTIGKLGKDFYEEKFGPGIMSAIKIKEMFTDGKKSNFNLALAFDINKKDLIGYCICYKNKEILHYSYPFYDLTISSKDMGLGMMTKAVQWANENNLKYIYLGSLQRPNDTYKLQFEGIEWFDGKEWKSDVEEVKEILGK